MFGEELVNFFRGAGGTAAAASASFTTESAPGRLLAHGYLSHGLSRGLSSRHPLRYPSSGGLPLGLWCFIAIFGCHLALREDEKTGFVGLMSFENENKKYFITDLLLFFDLRYILYSYSRVVELASVVLLQ